MQDLGMPLSLACLLAAALGETAAVNGADATKIYSVETVKNVTYYEGPDQHRTKHKLDLYLPKGLKDFPVLFFVHGGAWMNGDKDFFGVYGLFASTYARMGIGVVVTNYRLSPAVRHPEHAKDVARAVAWTCKNIAKHGGKPDQLFLCGHSAGGHLVALLTADRSYLEEHKLSAKAIRGVIPISGPFVIPDNLLRQVFGTDPDLRKKASPIVHARKNLPPFLILYADKDFPGCGRATCEAFGKALRDKGNQVETLEIKDSDHFRILAGAGLSESLVCKKIVEFIRSQTEK